MGSIAITGGLGHIGSSFLHDDSIRSWDTVTVVDNFLTNRHCSLFNLPRTIRFHELDITKDELVPVFEGADVVLHLAAIVNAGDTFDKAGATQETNSFGVGRVVKAAEEAGVRTLIHISTCSVYGPSANLRDEITSEMNPQSPYAQYKLDGESYVLASSIPNAYVLRACTIFGYSPGMRFHTVTNKFLLNALLGQKITIWKPGTGARPYLSLGDLRTVVANVIKKQPVHGIYNVVTHHWSPIEIVNEIREFVSERLKVEYVTPRILNQDGYLLSTRKAEAAGLYRRNEADAHTALRGYFQVMATKILRGVVSL